MLGEISRRGILSALMSGVLGWSVPSVWAAQPPLHAVQEAASTPIEEEARDFTTPTRLMNQGEWPLFDDDLDFRDMELAIQRQLKRFSEKGLKGRIKLGGKYYPQRLAVESLQVFLQLVKNYQACVAGWPRAMCVQDLNREMRARFNMFKPALVKGDPRFGEENFTFFTGYNTQVIDAVKSEQGPYKFGVYSNPQGSNRTKSRREIDFQGALKGKGLDLGFAKDIFDMYLLHIQGGGLMRVRQPDGSLDQFYISYDGTNGQKWTWISLYMQRKGYISNTSVAAQRKFLKNNPDKWEEILSQCPSYVYFKRSDHPPFGSDSTPLTDRRSIATDSKLYRFKGLLSYVDTQRPTENGNYDLEEEDRSKIPFSPFSRFYLDQDTGGAIKGKARVDLYHGEDLYAQFAAAHQATRGKVYFLMLKP
jgi:membrane-bound lytic murein transglycosylase A